LVTELQCPFLFALSVDYNVRTYIQFLYNIYIYIYLYLYISVLRAVGAVSRT